MSNFNLDSDLSIARLTNNSLSIQNCLNSTGANQDLNFPSSPNLNKYFYIKNKGTSTGNLVTNSVVISPGGFYSAIWDGVEWVSLYV